MVSLINLNMKMVSRVAAERAIISASVDDRLTSVWSLLAHKIGTPAYLIMNPVLERAVLGSYMAC